MYTGPLAGFRAWTKKYRIKVRHIVRTTEFYWMVIGLVFLNTLCVAIEHYGQPQWLTDFLDYAEVVFLAIFICEMLFKVCAASLRSFSVLEPKTKDTRPLEVLVIKVLCSGSIAKVWVLLMIDCCSALVIRDHK